MSNFCPACREFYLQLITSLQSNTHYLKFFIALPRSSRQRHLSFFFVLRSAGLLALQTCFWDVPGLNFGRVTWYTDNIFDFSSMSLSKICGFYLEKYVTAASLQIFTYSVVLITEKPSLPDVYLGGNSLHSRLRYQLFEVLNWLPGRMSTLFLETSNDSFLTSLWISSNVIIFYYSTLNYPSSIHVPFVIGLSSHSTLYKLCSRGRVFK